MAHLIRLKNDQNQIFFQEKGEYYDIIYTPVITAAKLVGIDYVDALRFATVNCHLPSNFTTDQGKYCGYLLTPLNVKKLASRYNSELYADIQSVGVLTYIKQVSGVSEPTESNDEIECDKYIEDELVAPSNFETPLMYMNVIERLGLNNDPDVRSALAGYLLDWFERTHSKLLK